MNKDTKIPELLAPAGTMESFEAAVHAGADAIYIGGEKFNARAAANNFSFSEMRAAIEYAHLYNVKVYIAINILIKQSEINELHDYIENLVQIAPDAVILQDLGAAKIINTLAPTLKLHASTQLTATNSYALEELKKLNFQRVVLARELSIEEMKIIKDKHPTVELEAFVHGAHCYCYSGQCLLSGIIGGRSGNRGQCAQPCRLQYSISDQTGTFLSPKDLHGLPYLEQLIDAGVNSLKIEGRLKNADYVYTVVKAYREQLQLLQATTARVEQVDLEKIDMTRQQWVNNTQKVFNREHSSGHLLAEPGKSWVSTVRHNNKGKVIGKVVAYDSNKQKISLQLKEQIVAGDGIYIQPHTSSQEGVGWDIATPPLAEKLNSETIYILDVPRHKTQEISKIKDINQVLVYKSRDQSLIDEIAADNLPWAIAINFHLQAVIGQQLQLNWSDEDGNSGTIVHQHIVEPAINHPADEELVHKQLQRLGNTPFALDKLTVDLAEGAMLPSSVLNDIRRQAAAACMQIRTKRPEIKFNHSATVKHDNSRETQYKPHKKPVFAVQISNSQLLQTLDSSYRRVIVAPLGGELEYLQTIKEVSAEKNGRELYVLLPGIARERNIEEMKVLINKVIELGADGLMVGQTGLYSLIRTVNNDIPIMWEQGMNVFNNATLQVLQSRQNANDVLLSAELNKHELKPLANRGWVKIHSRLKVMVSQHQLLEDGVNKGWLEDRKQRRSPVIRNIFNQTEIYNSQITSLLQEFNEVWQHNFLGLIVDVSRDLLPIEQTTAQLEAYAQAYNNYTTENNNLDLSQLLEENFDRVTLTRGHWERGVK